MQNSEII